MVGPGPTPMVVPVLSVPSRVPALVGLKVTVIVQVLGAVSGPWHQHGWASVGRGVVGGRLDVDGKRIDCARDARIDRKADVVRALDEKLPCPREIVRWSRPGGSSN